MEANPVITFATKDKLADALCEHFQKRIAVLNQNQKPIRLAFSGGSTPGDFFDRLAAYQEIPAKKINWENIQVFWVDERCVPPGHPESNYSMTAKRLLHALHLDDSQIHRIRGENDPSEEAARYESEIRNEFHQDTGIPSFDWIFLGLGEDGHTASIFPGRPDILHSPKLCEATRHPSSGQNRVTMTGPLIMQADRISFLVSGNKKSSVVRQIIRREPEAEKYPAYHIIPAKGELEWFLDYSASELLNLS